MSEKLLEKQDEENQCFDYIIFIRYNFFLNCIIFVLLVLDESASDSSRFTNQFRNHTAHPCVWTVRVWRRIRSVHDMHVCRNPTRLAYSTGKSYVSITCQGTAVGTSTAYCKKKDARRSSQPFDASRSLDIPRDISRDLTREELIN